MIATLIICVMVGVLTFYQVFKQGLFSTTIMAVWTLVAAMIAFNYYEVLHEQLLKLGLVGYPTEAATLVGLFIVSLLILRLASDQLIKGNMKFTMLIDRIGGYEFNRQFNDDRYDCDRISDAAVTGEDTGL